MEELRVSRAAALDDVVISISNVEYGDEARAVRLELQQSAFDDKPYVDLAPHDVRWLAQSLLAAADTLENGETSA